MYAKVILKSALDFNSLQKDVHLAKRFRTKRTGEEEPEEEEEEEEEQMDVKQEVVKTEQRKFG